MRKLLTMLVFVIFAFMVGCSSAEYYNGPYSTTALYLGASAEASALTGATATSREEYTEINENDFISTSDMPVSTFSADVDTAAYSIIRKKLMSDEMPYRNSVRIEEMLNYFNYNLDGPEGDERIHVTKEIADAPWNTDHKLLMLGLKTEDIIYEEAVPSNLVFLLDVSGSMSSADKLPLLKQAILMLVDELRPSDRISIVVYAGAAGLVLDGADGGDKDAVIDAINALSAGGSTAGGAGIQLAYEVAAQNYIEGGNNRVILATDGDFNVGISNTDDLEDFISEKRETGVFLSVFGFGTGNIKDNNMETLADKGNGSYHYIDTLFEAKRVFIDELGGTMVTVAKEVKLQIEFNPALVKGYRLIGYENRLLDYDDFNDDSVDAGDMGAGHEVIVLYELILADSIEEIDPIEATLPDELKYDGENYPDEIMTLSIRYKDPEADTSELVEHIVYQNDITDTPSDNFLFASSVAEFGLLLLDSEYKYNASYNAIIARATDVADDEYKEQFIELVQIAFGLSDTE